MPTITPTELSIDNEVSLREVYNFHTTDDTYVVVDKFNNNILVHNCLCLPFPDTREVHENAEAQLEKLHDDLKIAELHFDKYEVCEDVAKHQMFMKKFSDYKAMEHTVSAAIFGKHLLISNWVPSLTKTYIASLSNLYNNANINELVDNEKITFPAFNQKHLVTLNKSGILEFDGRHYCFSKMFIKSEQTDNYDSKVIDDLLQARQYAVRWSTEGEPVYDDSDILNDSENKEFILSNLFLAFFFDNDNLMRSNPLAWQWILNKVKKVIKLTDI